MTTATETIREYLDSNHVNYRVIDHQPAGSAEEYHEVLGTRYEQQAKAVFIRFKRPQEKGFAILALQAQKRADMERVRRLLNAREVRLGTREQMQGATGCSFGELPPLGRPYGLPLLFDAELLQEDEIFFNAGGLSTSIAVDPSALQSLEEPIVY